MIRPLAHLSHKSLRVFVLAIFLVSCLPSFAYTYRQHSGTYKAQSTIDVKDYPDNRASTIHEINRGEVFQTKSTIGQMVHPNAILSHLFMPDSNWMAVRLPSGKIGFAEYKGSKVEKIAGKESGLNVDEEEIIQAWNEGKHKYVAQGKSHLKWLGIATLAVAVLFWLGGAFFEDSTIMAIISLLAMTALLIGIILYFIHNPHSMWFVSPTCNGWWYTILWILPTIVIAMLIFGEFVGSINSLFHNPINLIETILLGAILFFIGKAVYLEVLDMVGLMLLALAGAGARPSSEHGTLVDQATGETLIGVRFSGNKAYSDGRTFTNRGDGLFR